MLARLLWTDPGPIPIPKTVPDSPPRYRARHARATWRGTFIRAVLRGPARIRSFPLYHGGYAYYTKATAHGCS